MRGAGWERPSPPAPPVARGAILPAKPLYHGSSGSLPPGGPSSSCSTPPSAPACGLPNLARFVLKLNDLAFLFYSGDSSMLSKFLQLQTIQFSKFLQLT